MDPQSFTSLFKDLISRLYDRIAVESHPLTGYFPCDDDPSGRVDAVRRIIQEEIEQLRPAGKGNLLQMPEARPYLILHKRYIEALDPRQIAASLYIGDRQFRRDQSRALQILSTRIWNKYFSTEDKEEGEEAPDIFEDQGAFELHTEEVDLNEVIRGVISLIRRRLEIENVQVELILQPAPLRLSIDRILLRQVLLSLLNVVLHVRSTGQFTLVTEMNRGLSVRLLFAVDEQWAAALGDERDSFEFARRLSQRLPARVEQEYPPVNTAGRAELRLEFTGVVSKTVLIVDDQLAAHKMLQRYLSRVNLEVIGITDPSQCLSMAERSHPALLILDVMMPHVDGWEVMQNLQLNPLTKDIPVIICSAWGEPELARSLGAAAFLKKPFMQKDLLDVLSRLGLI